ncbi:MAG TPA: SCP2 sterol-binding domain-containing protein [Candidatus Obscuribacter sp.]|nr:SCP2 sterol-binding domain-containing protein [Candidatus Melainabacteria bacterium]MBK8222090.1 SCP2 sterol-binding domain-containing protein [Candidatus Obscuribacter sp.]MBK9282100.1 SCP2 sterol-binding domain-containing protein [Candidatus Obscuribacter sp.]MDX1990349.1 SCP2 sterol-binding domain-containing protein [Candidatus Obscuribacter sp.]HMX48072.1 SCP2 sterol-binding domain-containing protein [Candidatus Obscuribacter sp.]
MAVFSSTEELHRIMEDLWNAIKSDEQMAGQLLASRLIVQFHYREPEGRLTIDCSDGVEMKIHSGECEKKPIVEMFMKSDVAHEFWLGKVNVPMALLQGKIVSKGPVSKALALLPALKPAYPMYPTVIKNNGLKVSV